MAPTVKPIKDWKKIMLDTTCICSLFTAQKPDIGDENIKFTKSLIEYLSNNNSSDSKPRTFYISTVTISELLTRENDSEKIKRILSVLNSKNVEFLPFDLESSLVFNRLLYPFLSKDALHEKAKEFGFKVNDYMMAREWITRDYQIIATANNYNADVILTADKKTFYPLTIDCNMPCVLTYPDLFNKSEQFIIKYHQDKVDNFLKGKA